MALSTNLKSQYLNNENKYILPRDAGENNRDLAATVAANFASVTYRMPNEDVERLSHATRADIVAFYQEYFPILEERIGANHEYHPFYPNFPQEVMERDDIDFFFDQVIYGLSGFEIRPEVYEETMARLPYMGYKASHPLSAGSEKDYIDSVQKVMLTSIAYTPKQREYISSFLTEYERAERNLPDFSKTKNHENRVVLASAMMDAHYKAKHVIPLLSDANDIIKYAAVRSAQEDYAKKRGNIVEISNGYGRQYKKEDFYHYASLRFPKSYTNKLLAPTFRLSRAERGLIIAAIEANAAQYGEQALEQVMMNNKREWKSLIKNIHIGDYPYAKKTAQAFDAISKNKPIERTSRTVEEAIKTGDIRVALEASSKQPGDFIRRTDKFLQMGLKKGDVSHVINTLRDVASKASISTLLSLSAHIQGRTEKKAERIFNIAASNRRFKTEDKRATLTPLIADMVHSSCIDGIAKQMEGKDIFAEPDAKVYISPKTSDYKIPNDVRNLSSGTHTYTVGSKVDVSSPSDFRRLFVWWTNTEKERVDIDLSVGLYDKDAKLVMQCGWNTTYKIPGTNNYGVLFSGDVQDGGSVNGKGAAEFMDINVPALRNLGVKYIVPSVNSYCGEPFSAMKNISFGFMDRDSITKDGMDGRLFEPSTVESKFDLNAAATSCIPCIFDISDDKMKMLNLDEREAKGNDGISMTWVDTPYNGRVASRDTDMINTILTYVTEKSLMDVSELVAINAGANRVPLVSDPVQATTIVATDKEVQELQALYPDVDFSEKTIIHPDDLNYIMGTLMATAQELPAKEKEVPEIDFIDISPDKSLNEILKDMPDIQKSPRTDNNDVRF